MLSAHNIVAGYVDEIDILQDVSVDAEKEQITSVIGPNGSGKSTLVRVICGFLNPKSGTVTWDGTDLTGRSSHDMAGLGICYLPQERTVFPYLTVEQNIRLGAWTFRDDKARIVGELERVYDLFPLMRERRRSKAGDLSGGMQKILEIARGMMIRPEILICDEPTVGLAPIIAKESVRYDRAPQDGRPDHPPRRSERPGGDSRRGPCLRAGSRPEQGERYEIGVRDQPARHDQGLAADMRSGTRVSFPRRRRPTPWGRRAMDSGEE